MTTTTVKHQLHYGLTQPPTLPEWEICTGQSVLMLCGCQSVMR